jgi:hypothetical protein
MDYVILASKGVHGNPLQYKEKSYMKAKASDKRQVRKIVAEWKKKGVPKSDILIFRKKKGSVFYWYFPLNKLKADRMV